MKKITGILLTVALLLGIISASFLFASCEKKDDTSVYDGLLADYAEFKELVRQRTEAEDKTEIGQTNQDFLCTDGNFAVDVNTSNFLNLRTTFMDYTFTVNYTPEEYNYKIKDLNSDGIDELIFCGRDDTLLALFTHVGDKTVLLDSFTPRYTGLICENGRIVTRVSGGAITAEIALREIDRADDSLTARGVSGNEENSVDGETVIKIYILRGDVKEEISEEEFDRMYALFKKGEIFE